MSPVPPLTPARGGVATLSLAQAMQRAVAAYQRGERREAEQLCRTGACREGRHFDALYLLAIIAGQAGRAQEAIELLSRALAVNPNSADAHYNRGVALGELKRPADALESYERAIALRPDYADAHLQSRRCAGRARTVRRTRWTVTSAPSRSSPDYAEAYNNRGIALVRLRRPAEALASYERAIALKPATRAPTTISATC